MFQPEPTPFASVYYPSSPYSFSSQSSSDAPPSGPPPLDPTTFDFGYRIAALGGGGGAPEAGAEIGIGIGSAPAAPLGRPGPGPGPGPGFESGISSRAAGTQRAGPPPSQREGAVGVGTPARQLKIPGQRDSTTTAATAERLSSRTVTTIGGQSSTPLDSSAPQLYSLYSASSPSSASSNSNSNANSNTAPSASPSSSCSAVSPSFSYRSPTTPYHHLLPLRHQQQNSQQCGTQRRYSHSPLATMDNHEQDPEQDQHGIAAQQAAAKGYQPEFEGSIVGNFTPSSVITQEYAKADPIYVEKTINLPQQFSHYRPIRGDGNCGWRAIGFSYFEKLVESGTRALIDVEIARLNHYNANCLAIHGGYGYWEDFAEAFTGLLAEVADLMTNPSAALFHLFTRWNDDELNNHLIYYMRLLAGTHLKMNIATYDAFVADSGGILSYCSSNVELINKEIEHIGISAIVNVLLKPVNLVLEIAYLDLSPGTASNIYRFPDEANGQDRATLSGMIYLLYRPTHYDILYRTLPALPGSPSAQASPPYSVQVHRVGFSDTAAIASAHEGLDMYSGVDFETLALIPSFNGPSMALQSPLATGPPLSGPFSPAQQSPWAPQFSESFPAAATPSPRIALDRPPPTLAAAPSPDASSPNSSSMTRPTPVPRPTPLIRTTSRSSPACTIRFSPMQLQYDGGKDRYPEMSFNVTTNTFKNSVWNRAHFGNPDFHPEEWSPEDENIDGRFASRKKSR